MNTVNFLKNTGNKVKDAGKEARNLVGATGLAVALSLSPVMAEENNQTLTINGQVYTMEQVEANEDLWDYMSDEQITILVNWQNNNIAQENEKQAQENEKQEKLKLQIQQNYDRISKAEKEGEKWEKEGEKWEKEGEKWEKEGEKWEKEGEKWEKEGEIIDRKGEIFDRMTKIIDIYLNERRIVITKSELIQLKKEIATINFTEQERKKINEGLQNLETLVNMK